MRQGPLEEGEKVVKDKVNKAKLPSSPPRAKSCRKQGPVFSGIFFSDIFFEGFVNLSYLGILSFRWNKRSNMRLSN